MAQLRAIPIRSYDVQAVTADTTLALPFWEDFAQTKETPDSIRWRYGSDVYVNDGLAINPPTYNVATLDGLRGDGTAYDIANEIVGETDSLVSQKIDLSGLGLSDNVFMSFYWQAGGNGELPDDDDSLSLQFLNIDGSWETVWSIIGGTATADFKQEILGISAAKFMHAGFKFKFQSYGNVAGPFDAWHLDYIYINKSRSINDLTHLDRAVTGNLDPLFALYTHVPAKVLFEDPSRFPLSQGVLVSNLDDKVHSFDIYYKLENLNTAEVYVDQLHPIQSLQPLQLLNIQTEAIFSPSDGIILSQDSPADSQVVRSTFYMNSGDKFLFEETNEMGDSLFTDVDLRQNDTLSIDYTLQNFFAYDDGTAEYAYGINVNKGKIAVRYVLPRADTLSHIDICFPSINPSAVGEQINVMVWSRLEEEKIIAIQSHTIQENTHRNMFQRIKLQSAKYVNDTIYIGFQQLREDYIGVGFDKSNPDAMETIWTKTTTTMWEQNDRLAGAFMIRPVFAADSTFILSTEEVSTDQVPNIVVYPNPSSGTIWVDGAHEHVEVYNLSGSMLFRSSRQDQYRLDVKPGLYILRVYNKNKISSRKLIIR